MSAVSFAVSLLRGVTQVLYLLFAVQLVYSFEAGTLRSRFSPQHLCCRDLRWLDCPLCLSIRSPSTDARRCCEDISGVAFIVEMVVVSAKTFLQEALLQDPLVGIYTIASVGPHTSTSCLRSSNVTQPPPLTQFRVSQSPAYPFTTEKTALNKPLLFTLLYAQN
jgi:hypothetical protein